MIYNRAWINENSVKVIANYHEGLTLRQLYYRLVSIGMTNDLLHYKKVVAAMGKARWDGIVSMDSFIDRERAMYGKTQATELFLKDQIDEAKDSIKIWLNSYFLERWSNQTEYIEVWIEKKALQGVFERPCSRYNVGLAPCKGYPSITFLNEARERFQIAKDDNKNVTILYFGDFDPSGEDIPRSIEANLAKMGCSITMDRRALHQEQIDDLNLPSVPPKKTDSRTSNWSGSGVVELDAVEPNKLKKMAEEAINEYFDEDLYFDLKEKEKEERLKYQLKLKEFVKEMKDE